MCMLTGDGELWDARCGGFHVSCAVGDEAHTWGQIKDRYR